MDLTPLSALLYKSAKKFKLEESSKASLVGKYAQELIYDIFSKVTRHPEHVIQKIYFTGSTITVEVTNSSVAQELHLRQEDLLSDLNKKLPEAWVEKIRIKIT